MPLTMRVMSVFSVPLFFYMGVVAPQLHAGGVACWLARRGACWLACRGTGLAMVLLALAVNAHVFAIPVAAGLFVWFYWLAPEPSLQIAAGRLRECRFWISPRFLVRPCWSVLHRSSGARHACASV